MNGAVALVTGADNPRGIGRACCRALAARGAVNLHTQKYALDDFQSAITDLDNGNVRGRAILVQ